MRPSMSDFWSPQSSSANRRASTPISSAVCPGSSPCRVEPTPMMALWPRAPDACRRALDNEERVHGAADAAGNPERGNNQQAGFDLVLTRLAEVEKFDHRDTQV